MLLSHILVLLLLLGVEAQKSGEQAITIVVLGESGIGKSALANVLLGHAHNRTGGRNGCFTANSHNLTHDGPYTTLPCIEEGYYLGNHSNVPLRVVDTPGFGFSGPVDDNTIQVLVDYLKQTVNGTNSFLLLFNGIEKRFTRTTMNWLTTVQNIFGVQIWDYVIIGVTHWGFATNQRATRTHTIPKMTEEWWALEVNYFLHQRFDLSHDLPVVFIDSFANKEDPAEEVAFRYNARQLMFIMTNLATKERFLFQDISRVRSELSAASYKAKKLELDVKIMEEKISNLTDRNRILQRLKAELNNPLKKLESTEKKCKAYKDEYQYSINAIYVAAICGFLVPVAGVAFIILIQCWIARCGRQRQEENQDEAFGSRLED